MWVKKELWSALGYRVLGSALDYRGTLFSPCTVQVLRGYLSIELYSYTNGLIKVYVTQVLVRRPYRA